MDMQVAEIAGEITKVTLQGRLDILAAQQIDLRLALIAGNHQRVIIDLERVPMIGSMGIRTLVIGAKTMMARGGRMALLRPGPDVLTVLEDTGADTMIPIFDSLDAAIAAVSA